MPYSIEPFDDSPRDVRDRKRDLAGFGLHSTGSTIVTRALDAGRDPNFYAAEHYDRPGKHGFPHDLVTWKPNGLVGPSRNAVFVGQNVPDVIQIADSDYDAVYHGNFGKDGKRVYDLKFQEWLEYVVRETDEGKKYVRKALHDVIAAGGQPHEAKPLPRYDWWSHRWPNFSSPMELYPGRNPNEVLLGIEMVVPVEWTGKRWVRLAHTKRQHRVAAWFCALKAAEHKVVVAQYGTQVLGHEDWHPIARTAKRGPWDPGHGRYWDWGMFWEFYREFAEQEPNEGPGRHP